ncbi:MAG TPA: FtsW/RodA/SpoVE family cell cycle protein [Streptosporangiaceae bacterium]|nr:FtsW/RodA/SpoVE family cell cycle protein [Streptosporangiaceae bacterium]
MSRARLQPRAAAVLGPLDRPLTSYYLLLGCTGLLLAIGLVMVLSTSSAIQLVAGQSPYSDFVKQMGGALAGLVIMWVLSRAPARLFRVAAYPMLLAAIASLLIVLAFGKSVAGAERWIVIAHQQVQPSEFAKFAFLVWGADLLARKEQLGQLNDWRSLLIPLLPGAAVIAMLVMLGDDLGTTFLLLVILLALLWVVGVPARMFLAILGLIVFALLVLVVVGSYGGGRISGFLNPGAGGPTGPNMQSIQGQRALGSGGLFGVGLGNSLEKWGWVPYANTDFIFAILGEELGLVGTACVVLLYGGLAYAGLRVARRVADPFMRFAAAGAVAWIVGQALVNICAVIGLLPITGVPLPLISQGLSSVIATMAAVGMLLAFARCEPGAREALAAVDRRLRPRLPAALRHATPRTENPREPARQRPAPRALPVPGLGTAAQRARPGRGRRQAPSRLADPGGRPAPPGRGLRPIPVPVQAAARGPMAREPGPRAVPRAALRTAPGGQGTPGPPRRPGPQGRPG